MNSKELIKIAYDYLLKNNFDEDLIQDALVKLYVNLEKFNPEKSSIQSFAFTIAKRIEIDKWRKEKNRKEINLSNFDKLGKDGEYNIITSFIPSDEFNPEEKMIKTQDIENLSNLINKLPISQLTIMHLFYIKQLNVKEIADKEQISYRRVRYYLSEGRENIGRILNGEIVDKEYAVINTENNQKKIAKTFKEASKIIGCTLESARLGFKENRVIKKKFRIILNK